MRDNEKKRQYLNRVAEKINLKQAKYEIVYELDGHIDERAQFYEEIGYTRDEAFEKAVEQMGDPDAVGDSLSRLHPKGIVWKIFFSLLSLLWFCALILFGFALWFIMLGDGIVGGGLAEAVLLLSFIGISHIAKKRDCIFLSVLLPILFFIIYGLYAFAVGILGGNLPGLFSPLIFNFCCLITGDFTSLALLPYVGGVTVAPWLSWTSIVFYVLIYFLLISVSVSTIKLHRPPYSLFTKRVGNRVTAIEKTLCVMITFVLLVSWIPFETPSERMCFFEGESFDAVYVLQSDTPCAIEDVKEEDIWSFGPDYDWSEYVVWGGGSWGDTDLPQSRDSVETESLTIPCGNKMCYRVDKSIFTCYVTKPYVSICFVHRGNTDYSMPLSEILPKDLEWQKSETVGTVSRAFDAYNRVDVVIDTAA